MTVDLSKKYETRGGREVRLRTTHGGGEFPVLGEINDGGEWSPDTWKLNGRNLLHMEHKDDLVEVKPQRTVWVNFYTDGSACGQPTREAADRCAVYGRIACVEITFTEGQGL